MIPKQVFKVLKPSNYLFIGKVIRANALVVAAVSCILMGVGFNYLGSPAVQPYPGEAAPEPKTNSPPDVTNNPNMPSVSLPKPPSGINPPTGGVGTGTGGNGGPGGVVGGGGVGGGAALGGDIALAVIPLGLIIVMIRLGSLQGGKSRRRKGILSEEQLYHSIEDIREMCQSKYDEADYSAVMVDGYHALDAVLADFYGLKRGRAMTPLEFAQGTMLAPLQGLVSLFYEARYGRKGQDMQRAQQFILQLDGLAAVVQEAIARLMAEEDLSNMTDSKSSEVGSSDQTVVPGGNPVVVKEESN